MLESSNVINAEKVQVKGTRYTQSKQSANVLFKFMGELRFLKEIIENKAIIPRYYEEVIDYLNVDGLEKIVFPMVCFCDINLSKLDNHVRFYGKFGIALNKKWGINKGVQCINYINKNSNTGKDFSYLFTKALNNLDESKFDEYNNYLFGSLLFMKPLVGKMLRNGKRRSKNFTDEKEWRYVPKIQDDDKIQLLIPQDYVGDENVYYMYSEGMKKLRHLWLTFNYDDIEYIMVETKADRKDFIDFIMNNESINCDTIKKYELISKIIVYNVVRKDW